MYAWPAFLCNAPSHSYSQLAKLVDQGANLAAPSFCPPRFRRRRIKGLPFLAFMGFIRCVTRPRLRHGSSEHVNLRTDTQTLPPPSLSTRISLTSRTSPPLTSAPLHFPLRKKPVARPARRSPSPLLTFWECRVLLLLLLLLWLF